MFKNLVLHTLSLIEDGNIKRLANLVADVQNLKKFYRRALRLGVWRMIDIVRWRILETTIKTLMRVRSRILLNSLIQIIIELTPNLLTRFENRLLTLMKNISLYLHQYAEKTKDSLIKKLAEDKEYLFTQAIKQYTSEKIGFIYSEL